MLFLLTIICSYKSGYTTMMTKSDDCRPVLKELASLYRERKILDLDDYVDGFMGYEAVEVLKKNEDYYKQYSYLATKAIKDAVGTNDDPIFYLFDNVVLGNWRVLRRMLIDVKDIELPAELKDLADRMPDAMGILNPSDNQGVKE